MSERQERFDRAKQFITSEETKPSEALVYLYYWFRYERALMKRDYYNNMGRLYTDKLNNMLTLHNFRVDLRNI